MSAKRIAHGAIQAPCDVRLRIPPLGFLSGRQGDASVGFCVDSSQEMERNWMYFRMTSPSYRILTLSSFTGGLPPPLRARRARIEATRMVSRDAGVSKKNLKIGQNQHQQTRLGCATIEEFSWFCDARENPKAVFGVPAAGVRWPSLTPLASHL